MKATSETPDGDQFLTWAVVEIFGHQKFAGLVTEASIGGCSFIRVDVPELGSFSSPAFTKLFTQGAIYSITPVSEDFARRVAASIRSEPVSVYMPYMKSEREIRDEEYALEESETDDALRERTTGPDDPGEVGGGGGA